MVRRVDLAWGRSVQPDLAEGIVGIKSLNLLKIGPTCRVLNMEDVKVFKFRGARAVLSQNRNQFELLINYKEKVYNKKFMINNKRSLNKIVDYCEEEIRNFIESKSLLNRIINHIRNVKRNSTKQISQG